MSSLIQITINHARLNYIALIVIHKKLELKNNFQMFVVLVSVDSSSVLMLWPHRNGVDEKLRRLLITAADMADSWSHGTRFDLGQQLREDTKLFSFGFPSSWK